MFGLTMREMREILVTTRKILFCYFLCRAWSGNKNAQDTIKRTIEAHPQGKLKVTLPHSVLDTSILDRVIKGN